MTRCGRSTRIGLNQTAIAQRVIRMNRVSRTCLVFPWRLNTRVRTERLKSGSGSGFAILILMIQLQSLQRLFLVLAVAPLGFIGVVAAMLPSGSPMGFVAILGVLALIGILIRNSVILVVQIEKHRREGMATWAAVLDATTHRTRPIMLTAAAASLALIPISREGFWAPMAFAMMGGIIVGTVLTLLFLPALYVAWFRVAPPAESRAKRAAAIAAPEQACLV